MGRPARPSFCAPVCRSMSARYPKRATARRLLYFTGSKAHNIALRSLANEHGWKLNEYGLFAGKRRIAGARSRTYTQARPRIHPAGIARGPRRDRLGPRSTGCRRWSPRPISAAIFTSTPTGPTARPHRRNGGRAKARLRLHRPHRPRRAWRWRMVSTRRAWRDQIREIDRLNDKLDGFTILKGIEVDILNDGRLDLPD